MPDLARRPAGRGAPNRVRGRGVSRSVRRVGGALIRRMGLVPSGVPDHRGQDEELAGTAFEGQILVYFADTLDGLYQLRQWYEPFEQLHRRRGLVVVTADSRTAAVIRSETQLPVVTVARYATLDDVLARSHVHLALYVNHNPENFSMLRFASLVHVSLLHGDSDKSISVSNQAKAYDFSFVAGRAAVDRLARYLPLFDAPGRCVVVGRPQLEVPAPRPRPAAAGPVRVLYAPTWEGAQPSVAYGSLESHGPALVEALLADGRFGVVYRPHPLSGVRLPGYGEADRAVRALVEEAAGRRPSAGHRISLEEPIESAFADADVLVCDVSAVAVDWLPTGRPLAVTVPVAPQTVTAATPILDTALRVPREGIEGLADALVSQVCDDPNGRRRAQLLEYYLGDTAPGVAMSTFLEACDRMVELGKQESARILGGQP